MRLVIQRVTQACVEVGGRTVGEIAAGLCILVAVGKADNADKAIALADKIKNLRIFEDHLGKMNRSVTDIGGAILAISQFTLYGDCRRGNRPSFTDAAHPVLAEELYVAFVQRLRDSGITTNTGQFRAQMKVSLVNDGPVTLILEN